MSSSVRLHVGVRHQSLYLKQNILVQAQYVRNVLRDIWLCSLRALWRGAEHEEIDLDIICQQSRIPV